MYPYINDSSKPISASENTLPEPDTDISRIAQLIESAAQEEEKAAFLYSRLAQDAKNEDCQIIYSSIADDNRYHVKLLNQLYNAATGISMPSSEPPEKDEIPENTVPDEIENSKFYRDLAFMSEDSLFVKTAQTIMADKQNHALLNLYVQLAGGCK